MSWMVAFPEQKSEIFAYAKTLLGEPVIQINVHDTQMEVCLRQALDRWKEYHYSATMPAYISYQLTDEDCQNKRIKTPEYVTEVVRVLSVKQAMGSGNASDLWWPVGGMNPMIVGTGWMFGGWIAGGFGNIDYSPTPWGMASNLYLNLMQEQKAAYEAMYQPDTILRYNNLTHELILDIDSKVLKPGAFIMYEVLVSIEWVKPEVIFQDSWLKSYFTALAGIQWGRNLVKFKGSSFGDSLELNGQGILDMYTEEKEKLESQLMSAYRPVYSFYVG